MTKTRLPSLNAVRTFAVAGRHLNLTSAAAELGVTQGAVSRLIQSLEADLGVELFRRSGRSVVMTAEGARYHREVAAALARIEAASRDLRENAAGAGLVINAIPTLAMRWLIPRLGGFQALHPEIPVDVRAGDGAVSFADEPADLVIRFGAPPFAGAACARLMEEEMSVVCSPAFLRRHGDLRAPASLLRLRLLQHSTRPWAWTDYLAQHRLELPADSPLPSFEHFFMLSEAAASGLGVALLPTFLIREEIASGRLVEPLADRLRPTQAYYLLWRPGSERRRPVRVFKTWLLKLAAQDAERT